MHASCRPRSASCSHHGVVSLRRRLSLRRLRHGAAALRLALAGFAVASVAGGCAGLPESHPPGGTVIEAVDKECFGPFTTATQVVKVDGARGPEFYRVAYTYRALLVGGSAEVRATGGLRLLEGTLLVHADRSISQVSAESASDVSASASTGGPLAPGEWSLEALLAQQLVAPDSRDGVPKVGSTPSTALWWFPIVVGNPTQGGTTGTTFVVQQLTDSTGAGVTRFFLRPPTTRCFGPDSHLWISRSDYVDGSVVWLSDTESFAESVTLPAGSVPDPKDPKDAKSSKQWSAPTVKTTISPLTDELRTWLTELEQAAAACGVVK